MCIPRIKVFVHHIVTEDGMAVLRKGMINVKYYL